MEDASETDRVLQLQLRAGESEESERVLQSGYTIHDYLEDISDFEEDWLDKPFNDHRPSYFDYLSG